MNTRKVGNEYENLACQYITGEGMRILTRNYRVKIGEIDIVAWDRNELVFIEVKYRKNTDFGGAKWAISTFKQEKIRRVAQWFMSQFGYTMTTPCRFDAVLIDGDDITHVKNAW